jgi:DNA invertase Pin-like site-specific DNA recombinase
VAELLEDRRIGDLVIGREQDRLGQDDAEHLIALERQHHLH